MCLSSKTELKYEPSPWQLTLSSPARAEAGDECILQQKDVS